MKCECGCGQDAPIAKRTRTEWGHIRGEPVRFIRGHATKNSTQTEEQRSRLSASLRHTDLSGQKFGFLVAQSISRQVQRFRMGKPDGRRTFWLCQCVCGSLCEPEQSKLTMGLVKKLRVQAREYSQGKEHHSRPRQKSTSWNGSDSRISIMGACKSPLLQPSR